MTFTINEWLAKMEERKLAFIAARERECLQLALDLQALVQLRIQTSGTNSQGAAFVGYSPGWEKNRQRRGRQVNYFDFTDTGSAWRSITPRVILNTPDTTVVETKARDQLNQTKLNAPRTAPRSRPRGNILVPDATEIADINAANGQRIIKYFAT